MVHGFFLKIEVFEEVFDFLLFQFLLKFLYGDLIFLDLHGNASIF